MTTTPMLEGIPTAQPEPRQAVPTCARCGRDGHLSKDCKQPIPSLECDDEPECERCHGDGRDPWNDYLLPCPLCQGEHAV